MNEKAYAELIKFGFDHDLAAEALRCVMGEGLGGGGATPAPTAVLGVTPSPCLLHPRSFTGQDLIRALDYLTEGSSDTF